MSRRWHNRKRACKGIGAAQLHIDPAHTHAPLAQRIEFFASGGQERVQPQTRMIVEIFVTQRQPIEALRQQRRPRVIHINLIPCTPAPDLDGLDDARQ